MEIDKNEISRIEICADSSMTSSNTGLMSLIPLFALTSLSATAEPLEINDYPSDFNQISVRSEMGSLPSDDFLITDGIDVFKDQSDISGLNFQLNETRNINQVNEIEVLDSFISNMLDNSKKQPSELKSLMYENIDDLLI